MTQDPARQRAVEALAEAFIRIWPDWVGEAGASTIAEYETADEANALVEDLDAHPEAKAALAGWLNDDRAFKEAAKDAIRALPALMVTNTEYVPQLKRRPDQGIDRAAALLAIEHLATQPIADETGAEEETT